MRPKARRDKLAEFRPVYLRPTALSDEAITVGLIVCYQNELILLKAEHPTALFNLQTFCGAHKAAQVIFALNEFREAMGAAGMPNIDDVAAPSDLLALGEKQLFSAADVRRDASGILRTLSSLYSSDFRANQPARTSVSHKAALDGLQQEIGRINVMACTNIFRGVDVQLPNKKRMRFPITGGGIMGDVVSFVTPRVLQAKLYSEASVARLCFAYRRMRLRPAIYLLTPSARFAVNEGLLEDAIGELRLITQEYEVLLKEDSSLSELAHVVLKDTAGVAA